MNPFDTLRSRGFVNQCTDEDGVRRLFDAGPATFYVGFDPTAASLHVGSLVPLMAMANLARAGHRPLAVVGGGTAMIGDPSGRDTTRELSSPERIAENLRGIGRQIHALTGAPLLDNADWLLPLSYVGFLRDIGSHFSVNRMLGAEGTRQRLERNQGLSFIEFNYVLLQSYDFLELYRREGCRLQVGGGDQWFNIVMGVELVRRLEGAEVYGLTLPLLTTSSGVKMGKTAAGAVWLDGQLLSPYDYYQYWVNTDDRDVERFFKLFTFLELDEVAGVMGGDIREARRRLAWEATAVMHGAKEAHEAAEAARAAFAGGVSVNMPTHAAVLPAPIVELLVAVGLAKSRSDARRLIEGGGVSVGEAKVGDMHATLDHEAVLWAGKKRAVRIVACPP